MTNCLNCGKELHHVEGRRKKKFCSNSCRVTYWQKTHAKSKITITGSKEESYIKVIEPSKKIVVYENKEIGEQPPERKEGENSIDYRIRRAEWFEQRNKQGK